MNTKDKELNQSKFDLDNAGKASRLQYWLAFLFSSIPISTAAWFELTSSREIGFLIGFVFLFDTVILERRWITYSNKLAEIITKCIYKG